MPNDGCITWRIAAHALPLLIVLAPPLPQGLAVACRTASDSGARSNSPQATGQPPPPPHIHTHHCRGRRFGGGGGVGGPGGEGGGGGYRYTRPRPPPASAQGEGLSQRRGVESSRALDSLKKAPFINLETNEMGVGTGIGGQRHSRIRCLRPRSRLRLGRRPGPAPPRPRLGGAGPVPSARDGVVARRGNMGGGSANGICCRRQQTEPVLGARVTRSG